jgi:hypothetical protein
LKYGISLSDITTEKELHQKDGFGTRRHQPDFIFTAEDKTHCVEVELTPKSKERTVKNLHDNFMTYDFPKWVVPENQTKIRTVLNGSYRDIEILSFEKITDFVKSLTDSEQAVVK